jgi:hypothetical protein
MSFNDIEPFRKALEGVPEGVITPAMASLLWVIVSYPNGCYIGQERLAKQARLELGYFKKVMGFCTKLGLIERDQPHAQTGTRQCYRVNMTRLLELGRVELITPTPTQRVEQSLLLGGTESPTGSNQVHPYRDNKNYKSSGEELFSSVLSFIPASSRFSVTKELRSLVEELEHRGTTLEVIRGEFSQVNWNAIDNPKLFVLGRLRDLMARPVKYTEVTRPTKCANSECDEKTRTLAYAVPVPNGNGMRTQSCLECSVYWVNKKNGY